MKNGKSNNSMMKLTFIFLKFILIPIICLLTVLIMITSYNFSSQRNQLQSYLNSSLRQYSSDAESRIQNAINISQAMCNNSEFINAVSASDLSECDTEEAFSAISSLSGAFEREIDSVMIYSRTTDTIASKEGTFPLSYYLTNMYSYEDYPIQYWSSLIFFDSSSYRILSPTIVRSGNEQKQIIPVVFRQVNSTRFKNYLIINISLDSLLTTGDTYMYTKNTYYAVLNRFNGYLFSSTPLLESKVIIDTELYKLVVSGKQIFTTVVNGKKHFVVSISSSNSLMGYNYLSLVPYSDIYQRLTPVIVVTVITILLIILMLCLAMFYSLKLALPLNQLAKTLNLDWETPSIKNTNSFFEYMKIVTHDIKTQNSNLSTTLPLAQTNYLVSLLNSTDYTISKEEQIILHKSLPFKYDRFSAVVLQMFPNEKFYELYDASQCEKIQSGFYEVVREIFNEKFTVFFLPATKESFYIILNVDDACTGESIDSVINTIFSCLRSDTDSINLYIGKGGIYSGFEGMKTAYQEALSNLNIIINAEPDIATSKKKNSVVLDSSCESKLFNDLVAFDVGSARQLISNELKIGGVKFDDRTQKQLYSQILNIIFRVMKTKGIPISNDKLDFEILSETLNRDPEEIYRTILVYLDKISSYSQAHNPKGSSLSMVSYINENFNDPNLSLDILADKFNTTTSYVSLILKKALGVGFYKYLTGLRIENACKLLSGTELTIGEICDSSGFSSKQTFFRIFKADTGITPNAYRKNNQK